MKIEKCKNGHHYFCNENEEMECKVCGLLQTTIEEEPKKEWKQDWAIQLEYSLPDKLTEREKQIIRNNVAMLLDGDCMSGEKEICQMEKQKLVEEIEKEINRLWKEGTEFNNEEVIGYRNGLLKAIEIIKRVANAQPPRFIRNEWLPDWEKREEPVW